MTTVCFLPPGPSACRGTRDAGVALGLLGAMGLGVGPRVGARDRYLSSPPARSFCRVELGPHVRPFFLPPISSSFFGGPLRPHVPLPPLLLPLLPPPPPSTGVTGPREDTWLLCFGKSVPAGLPPLLSPPRMHPPPGSLHLNHAPSVP